MLRLEKLEMLGFKSFLSRTEFVFHKNITAIVGPNGCGKSNIGDALNWVIGEQSVKSLRGDRMEDVIFNGSEGRKPLGMTEVSLHLSGGGNSEEESVVVTRRLFRSGESEYLINGQRSRLRDIQEALARIHVGSGVYSIIEQGKVDAALSSRPRERRILIEEAAGIALYKARKRQAEIKLEATEANLLRINDIVSEIERQVVSLKRQAAKARRYSRTVEEIASHERILLYHEHERLERERREVERREAEARAKESEAAGELARIEALFEEGRRLLEDQDALFRDRREELHALEREMDRQEREITLARDHAVQAEAAGRAAREQAVALAARREAACRQIEGRRLDFAEVERRLRAQESERERLESARQALEDRGAGMEADLSGLRTGFLQVVGALSDTRNHRGQIQESRESLKRRLAGLDREEAETLEDLARQTREREAVQADLARLEAQALTAATYLTARRADLVRLEEALSREKERREESRHRLHGHKERLRALEEIESTQAGARDLLEGVARHGGILADGLKVPAHLEAAAEIYLDRLLHAALVDGVEEAFAGIESLKASGNGRAGFLPAAAASPDEHPLIALPEEVRSRAGFVGRLGDLIQMDPIRGRALAASLARAVVVADLGSARTLRKLAPFFDYITLEGDILHTNGLIEGGARRPEGTGVLTRRRIMADLVLSIETGRTHLTSLDSLIAGLESERSESSSTVTRLAESLADREKDLVARRLGSQAAIEDEGRIRTRTDTVAKEKAMARDEAAALSLELERLTAMLAELEAARRGREDEIAATQEQIAALRTASSQTAESVSGVRAVLSASRQQLEAIQRELAQMLEADRELADRVARETALEADLIRRRQEAAAQEMEASEALRDLAGRRSGLEAAVRDTEVALASKRLESDREAGQARTARASLEEARGLREQITLEKERVAADLRHIIAGALGSSGSTWEDLFGAIIPEEKALNQDVVRAELADLRDRRDRMGPVNMLALDEFRELEDRHAFLTSQKKDLTEAVASLKETIARINRTSRERFLEAFEKIRAGFGDIFRTLFSGGRADLRLLVEDGCEDPLECGLEIIAQPPGKRLQSVSLLSGGERALAAIALLFAIFRFRPSPFCLLDEVDAPLDEANVIRFTDLLKSMSGSTQFVIITHNRASMEAAEILYGITMEEPGISRTMSVVLGGSTDRKETVRSLPAMMASRHRGGARSAPLAGGGNGRAAGRAAAAQAGNTEVPRAPEASSGSGSVPA